MCKFLKSLFSKKQKKIALPMLNEDQLKEKINILIIDDKRNDLVKNLSNHGWHAQYIRDLDSYEQPDLKTAHIICVDINGVGAKLGCAAEGMDLAKRIKDLYPEKKTILYSSQKDHDIFNDSLDSVDRRVYKTGEFYPFFSAVKELAAEIFNWDDCIEYLYAKYKSSFKNRLTLEDFKKQLESGASEKEFDLSVVMKITGAVAETATCILKVVKLCLFGI